MTELIFHNKGVENKLQSQRNFVIVGANGSGKSHLGAAIEKANPSKVLRISAQRALSVPDSVNISDYKSTWNQILYGNSEKLQKGYKWGWEGDEYTIKLVNDYSATLSSVFSYQSEEEHKFFNESKETISNKKVVDSVPTRITDRILSIWNSVFPQRGLIFESAKVLTSHGESTYKAKYMSDGERVALYLISQCLLAPKGMVIVVDEPEIHLHRSIMAKLWDAIEFYCTDKSFVYITHDLDFAASRKEAVKIWVKAYHGDNTWDVEPLPSIDEIPEDLMIEVLGNRKPVLFVEGEKTSYDFSLYSQVYENRYVIPAHNCTKVIELTKAFNNEQMKGVHHLDVKGIIDRDYLSENEVDAYKKDGIYTLEVAEVENLYLLESVVKIVAKHLVKDADEVFNKVKNFVFAEFEKEKDNQLKELCSRYISFRLQQYTKPSGNDLLDLKQGIKTTVDAIDIDAVYTSYKNVIDDIVANRDYKKLLSIYNRKNLIKRVSGIMGLSSYSYPDLTLNLLKTEKREELLEAFKATMPNL